MKVTLSQVCPFKTNMVYISIVVTIQRLDTVITNALSVHTLWLWEPHVMLTLLTQHKQLNQHPFKLLQVTHVLYRVNIEHTQIRMLSSCSWTLPNHIHSQFLRITLNRQKIAVNSKIVSGIHGTGNALIRFTVNKYKQLITMMATIFCQTLKLMCRYLRN